MYPFNYPFAKALGKIGVPLSIKILALHDEEADVYYAFSPNVKGLHVEAATLDKLRTEVMDALPTLLQINEGMTLKQIANHTPHLNICTPLTA